jgi:hypothetical protein
MIQSAALYMRWNIINEGGLGFQCCCTSVTMYVLDNKVVDKLLGLVDSN